MEKIKKKLYRKYLVIGVLLLFVGASVVPSVMSAEKQKLQAVTTMQNIWYVDDNNCPGPGNGTIDNPFCKIQYAINAASPNDEIRVFAGDYFENLDVDVESLTLIGGWAGTGVSTIDGSGSGSVVKITVDWVNISGFTIQNSGSNWDGIDMCSNYSTIMDNTIGSNNRNRNGISVRPYLEKGLYESTVNNTISGNTIINNNCGINQYVSGSSTISGNTIINSSCCGIYLDNSGYNNIYGNNITNNGDGIYLETSAIIFGSSSYNNIYRNNITNNDDKGIHISETAYECEANVIYHNNFINNTQNAYDEYIGYNTWYNSSLKQGNYWDDYMGVDILPPYGIGDCPYGIPPYPLRNYDRYPLMKPYPNPYNNNQNSQQNSQSSSQQPMNPLFFQILGRMLNIR